MISAKPNSGPCHNGFHAACRWPETDCGCICHESAAYPQPRHPNPATPGHRLPLTPAPLRVRDTFGLGLGLGLLAGLLAGIILGRG